MTRDPKPLLVWDGECSFCRRWIERWKAATGDRVEYAKSEDVADRYPEIPRERFAEAVHLREPDGAWSRGAEAVFRSLAYAPRGDLWLALYQRVPGFAAVSEAFYRFVARHRPAFDRITTWLWGAHLVPPGRRLTTALFLRALGVVATIAFVSLWTQVIGLAGRDGILSARDFLAAVAQRYGPIRFWYLPTLSWLDPSDGFLHAQCAAGTALGVLLALGIAPMVCLAGLAALYLSLSTVCQDFFYFQWDCLFVETLVLAIFLAPRRLRSRAASDPEPPRIAILIVSWLLFRLMFGSAIVKLASGDPHWRDLTALEYHYETQCLPPWTAWYMHHLPPWFQKLSAAAMFAIEGGVSFLIFAPRRLRFLAAAALAGLQAVIFVTGNYCFFNLLAIALCGVLLDDAVWPRWMRDRYLKGAIRAPSAGAPRRHRLALAIAAVLFVTSLFPLLRSMRLPFELGPVGAFYRAIAPLRVVNSYGLFAVMTTTRNEIVLEGSDDGASWKTYEFRDKPGDPMRKPRFVAPHQPRVDWQMWFAALSDYRREAWFLRFCERLLQGSRPVLALMGRSPFLDRPPRYLRAIVYTYHFTDAPERRRTGAWWRRQFVGLYCPVLTLEDGRLAAAPDTLAMPPPPP